MRQIVGSRITRLEDEPLLRGRGRFIDDIVRPGMLHACFVRSDVARARIARVDVSAALALDGVHEAGWYWHEGMTLPPLTSGAERLGYLLLTAHDEAGLDALTERALAALEIEIAAASPVA
jgi:hypothetical protein